MPEAANVIDKQAVCTGVNRPGDGSFNELTVDNGDAITYAGYTPNSNDYEVGIVEGADYNMFMLTSKDGTQSQAFIVWSPDEPRWQDILRNTNTVVAGIGSPGPNTLMRGDTIHISVQDAQGGGTDVTIDAWRGTAAVCTFSFVVK